MTDTQPNKRLLARRINLLNRVLAVQKVYQDNFREGLPDTYMYRTYILPTFHISERTFRDYLEMAAKKELDTLTK